jgi:predicted  nucleic acid-binding Zn-ribbon protein
MGKKKSTLEIILQDRYNDLAAQLKHYRKEYMRLQTLFPPESEYLIKQLTSLNHILTYLKSDILEVQKELKELQKEESMKQKRKFFARVDKSKVPQFS